MSKKEKTLQPKQFKNSTMSFSKTSKELVYEWWQKYFYQNIKWYLVKGNKLIKKTLWIRKSFFYLLG